MVQIKHRGGGYLQLTLSSMILLEHLNVRIVGEAILADLKTGQVSNDFPERFGRAALHWENQ